jgi:hypothetical protein
METDQIILRYGYHTPFKVQLPKKHEWQNGFNSGNKGGLVWYMDRSKTNTMYDTRAYKWGSKSCTASVWGFTPRSARTEIHAITACKMENTEKC